jgi:hypothetical protein
VFARHHCHLPSACKTCRAVGAGPRHAAVTAIESEVYEFAREHAVSNAAGEVLTKHAPLTRMVRPRLMGDAVDKAAVDIFGELCKPQHVMVDTSSWGIGCDEIPFSFSCPHTLLLLHDAAS